VLGAIPSLDNLPILANVAILAVGAVVVWQAGVRLARVGDVLAERTGIARAVFGMVFLALATSLPEVSTTVTASLDGEATLAMGNIFGGIVLQTAILALADARLRRGALTFFAPKPMLLLQGTLLIALLGLALAAIAAGNIVTVAWVGAGSIVVFVAYVVSLWLQRSYAGHASWQPVDIPDADDEGESPAERAYADRSTPWLVGLFLVASALVLVAGIALALASSALAQQTGLGGSFIGSTLLAASTSLPEVSTTLAAVQIGAYSLAVSNIFGSNALMVGLLLLADVSYLEGPILEQTGPAIAFGAAAGIVATAIYLAGLIERRDRQVWRLGIDSVVMVAFLGLVLTVQWVLR
jgi:cation:H+ antiporter